METARIFCHEKISRPRPSAINKTIKKKNTVNHFQKPLIEDANNAALIYTKHKQNMSICLSYIKFRPDNPLGCSYHVELVLEVESLEGSSYFFFSYRVGF